MLLFQRVLQLIDSITQRFKVAHIQYLAANMKMETDKINILHLFSTLDNGEHIPHSDTEFVLCQTCFYIIMCVRSNVWIDAKAYICHLLLGICQFVYDFKLRHTFHIEAENRGFKCQIYFPIGLSYACKNYFVSRKSRFNCSLNFSSAHAIGSKSSLCNYPQYFGISICFNSIVHVKVFFL